MKKLTRILNSKLPSGWTHDKDYTANFTGAYVYKHLTKGVVIVQLDYTGGSEKISVDSGRTEFNELKNCLITLDPVEANVKAIEVMSK